MKHWRNITAGMIVGFVLAAALWISPAKAQSSQVPGAGCTYAGCQMTWGQNGIQSFVKTYKFIQGAGVVASSPQDIFTIAGSASKTIRVTKIIVTGQSNNTANGSNLIYLLRRSAADAGGTASTPNASPLDVNNTAASATVAFYTANPTTPGAIAGTLDVCRLFVQAGTAQAPQACRFEYGVNNDQVAVLRGSSDVLALNLAGTSLPAGGVLDIDVEWTEEP